MSIMKWMVSRMAEKKMRETKYIFDHSWEMTQEKLFSILRRNQGTVYGRRFRFSTIGTPEQYAERVPLTDSLLLKPYLEMIYRDPTRNVLTVDPVVWYLQTAGTTGKPKRMPITKSGVKDVSKSVMMVWLSFIAENRENAKIMDGTLVTFGAAAVLDYINGIPVGYATGVYREFMNPLFRRLIKPGADVFNIQDMDRKMEVYAEILAKENVTGLQGITTLSLALIRRMQNQYGPWLIKKFRGTRYEHRIREGMDAEGHIDVGTLWPELRFFLATGIDSSPYKKWITDTFPLVQIREMYGASEGSFAGQVYSDIDGMQLFPNLNYYEFIPLHQCDQKNPETVPLTDLKKGQRYELVITNLHGYYRYRMGDLVTVVRTDPVTIKGVERKGNIVNLSGEKISEAHVTRAITAACLKTGAEIMDYSVIGVVENGLGHYIIAAMFHNDDFDETEFIAAFEKAMKQINEEFRVVRETGALGPTTLRKLVVSPYDQAVHEKSHQSKPIALTTDTEILRFCKS